MEEHQFDRRVSDVNVAALATRMSGLEGRVEILEQKAETNNAELRANNALTSQLHEAAFGKDDDVGMQGRVTEMYELFDIARNGFRFAGKVGTAGMWVIETGGKVAKPLFFIGAVAVAAITYVKTGTWTMPDWWAWFTK